MFKKHLYKPHHKNSKAYQLLQEFNLEVYLQKFNLDFKESTSEYILKKCPSCGDDHYKLYISKKTKQFFCFKCEYGKGKSLFTLMGELEGISSLNVYQKLCRGYSETQYRSDRKIASLLHTKLKKAVKQFVEPLPEIKMPFDFFSIENDVNPVTIDGFNYLAKRGVDISLIKLFDVKYCPAWKRVIFPIRMHGKLVGYQGRDILDRHKTMPSFQKAMSSKGLKKRSVLFNYDQIYKSDFVTIVEGPVDAVKAHRMNPVALLGKSISKSQRTLLENMPNLKKVFVVLDREAKDKIIETCDLLQPFFETRYVLLPEGKDPGNFNPLEFESFCLANSLPYNPMKLL